MTKLTALPLEMIQTLQSILGWTSAKKKKKGRSLVARQRAGQWRQKDRGGKEKKEERDRESIIYEPSLTQR